MKLTFIRYLLALCLAFAGSAFGQPISWKLLPGAGNDIGVGANGAVWVIGTNKSGNDFGIWRWNASAANWDQMPGGALRIDVDPQGVAWVVNSNHAIYRWGGSAWQMMPGLANDVGIGANGAVWVIGTNPTGGGYGIYRWNAGKNNWDQMPGGGVRIDVDPQGNAWIVNSEGSIYRWTGSTWQKMPGAAKDIGIGANGAVWVVGTDSGVYQWIGIEWIKREGALTDISVDAKGLPWGVNSNKAIYTASAAGSTPPPPPPPVATGPKSYLATGEALQTGQYLVADNKAFYAVMQGDGNLCVYKGSGPTDSIGNLWCNMVTAPGGAFYATQQGDGNFCVYKGTPQASKGYHWCNMKTGAGGQFFTVMQGDGNLCSYRGTGPGDNKGYQWCSGATAQVTWSPPNASISALQPFGTAKTVRSGIPGYDTSFPKNQPCPNDSYTVPAGVSYVKITAVGGAGVGGDSTNVVNNIVATGGLVVGKDLSAPSSTVSWADITGGSGGHGANVSAVYPVTAGPGALHRRRHAGAGRHEVVARHLQRRVPGRRLRLPSGRRLFDGHHPEAGTHHRSQHLQRGQGRHPHHRGRRRRRRASGRRGLRRLRR